ncbi:hypothetical protein Aperf_G00000124733 [Anoplocephala perfoliata]
MSHMNPTGDESACTDELKVYKDEGEEEEQKKSSENLTEDKVGLVIEGEGHTPFDFNFIEHGASPGLMRQLRAYVRAISHHNQHQKKQGQRGQARLLPPNSPSAFSSTRNTAFSIPEPRAGVVVKCQFVDVRARVRRDAVVLSARPTGALYNERRFHAEAIFGSQRLCASLTAGSQDLTNAGLGLYLLVAALFKVPHGAPAGSPHAKRSALSVDGLINNSAAATAAAAAAASASNAYAAGLHAAAAAAIGLGQLADLSAVYRQATTATDQASGSRRKEEREGLIRIICTCPCLKVLLVTVFYE